MAAHCAWCKEAPTRTLTARDVAALPVCVKHSERNHPGHKPLYAVPDGEVLAECARCGALAR